VEEAVRGIPFLEGERVYLRGLVESDADGPYPTWFNDAEVCRGNSHHVYPYSPQDAVSYIARVAGARDSLVLAVVMREGDQHIGNIALQQIHPVYRSAELTIVIGDRQAWGKGYAGEAARLICGHGFMAMNLARIGCGTFEDNTGMQRLAERLGMRQEGRRRRAAFKQGRFVDVIEYGVLQDEWMERWQGAGASANSAPAADDAA
jgi:[ribosomal protein S5]-alanine N-acetyltransferase